MTSLAAVVLSWSAPGSAAEWRIVPSMGVEESFSDNGNLATEDEDREAELSTIASPSIAVSGRGGRGSLNLNYTLDQVLNHFGGEDRTDHNLAALGQMEVWERAAFVDAQASISRQVIDASQPSSSSVAARDENRTPTYAFNISPYFLHHFGTWVETESRIRYSQVNTETDEVSDTSELSESIVINSGRRFLRMPWAISAINSELDRGEDEGELRERIVTADATYIINRQLSLIGSLGWENIEDPTLVNNPSGLTWRGGFAAQPGSRTSLRLTYGLQEDNESFDFAGNYQVSSRTAVTAAYNESIQTSQSQISQDLSGLRVDPVTGGFIDANGQPFDPGNEDFNLTDDSFRQKRFTLTLSGSRKRNVFSGQLSWESRDFEASGREETVLGAEVRLTRTLSHQATASAGFSVEHSDFSTGSEEGHIEYNLNVVYGYQLLEDARLTLAYTLTVRDADTANRDFYENAVTAGLTKTF